MLGKSENIFSQNGGDFNGDLPWYNPLNNHQQKQIWAKVQAKKITSMTEGHISYIKAFSKPGAKWRSVGHRADEFLWQGGPKVTSCKSGEIR